MKLIKKIAAIMLSVIMVLGMASVVSAEEGGAAAAGTITINKAAKGETYKIYRILDLESYSGNNFAYKVRTYESSSTYNWSTFIKDTDIANTYVKIDNNYVTWIGEETAERKTNFIKKALEYAAQQHHDVILIDTAGRLHINEELMQELQDIKTAVRPQEILLVVDAMTGQDAVTVAESFDGQLGVDGIILTKLDGDARGGAALSVRSVTNKPIKYIGMGEKMEDLEPFYPDRMASRILGMGDVLSLIDKVQANIDEQEALDMAKKMRANDFTLEDFLAQMQQIKKMGPLKDLLGMMPGIPGMGKLDLESALNGVDPQKEMARTEAIIQSMTKEERANPSILNGPRKKRIAAGCGRSIADVNRLIKQFEEMKKMMKQMNNMQKGKKGKFPFFR